MESRKGMKHTRGALAALLLSLGATTAAPAHAESPSSADRVFDSVSIYAAQGVDHNLLNLPGAIVSGQVHWDKSYFTAVGLGKTRGTLGEDLALFRASPLGGVRHGYELLFAQHHGLQSNGELGGAYLLRTPDLQMGWLGVNFAAGAGLSYALGTPSYEDGSKDDPERRYRLQMLALFELEWRIRGVDHLALVTRAHHRCGVYGLIAPQHVGSNFLAAGLRYEF